RPEGGRALDLLTPPPQHTTARDARDRLLDQARLPGAGLPTDEDQPGTPPLRRGNLRRDRLQLGTAADEGATRPPRERHRSERRRQRARIASSIGEPMPHGHRAPRQYAGCPPARPLEVADLAGLPLEVVAELRVGDGDEPSGALGDAASAQLGDAVLGGDALDHLL